MHADFVTVGLVFPLLLLLVCICLFLCLGFVFSAKRVARFSFQITKLGKIHRTNPSDTFSVKFLIPAHENDDMIFWN